MPKIQDVMDTFHRANLGIEYFGCSKEWREQFDRHVRNIGIAIALDVAENVEITDLSPQLELGPLVNLAYFNLLTFIKRTSQVRHSSLF